MTGLAFEPIEQGKALVAARGQKPDSPEQAALDGYNDMTAAEADAAAKAEADADNALVA